MPADALSPVVGFGIDILSNARTGHLILGAGLLISVFTNWNMYKIYKAEIKRLADERKILIHGLQKGSLSQIENHISCNTDI